MAILVLAAIAGATFVAKKISDITSGLKSGNLTEMIARYTFVSKISDVIHREGFPYSQMRLVLQHPVHLLRLGEYASRTDPISLLMAALGPRGFKVFDKAKSLSTAVLEIARKLFGSDSVITEIIKRLVIADSELDLREHVIKILRGVAVASGLAPGGNVARTGDPILLHSGEFEREVTDLKVSGAGIDFELNRTYRSGAVYFGPLGPVWDHSYNLRLREENEYIVVRLTGQLSEHEFIKHPRYGESNFSYYAPSDGVHDVIVPDGNSSFMLKRPQGVTYRYQATAQPGEHRIRLIEDRFGNYLEFLYSPDDQLSQVRINSPFRYVDFHYDEIGRLARIADHTGRAVVYSYSDFGYLDCVAGPALPGKTAARIERYEYDHVAYVPKLSRVVDWAGRIVVENEYDGDQLSDHFGKIIRQRQNRGESTYFYDAIHGEISADRPLRDTPALRVWESRRNGHQVEHVLNHFGNELLRRERIVEGGRIREAVRRYRYNADGEVIAELDPDGVLTQHLFEREHIADRMLWPDIHPVLGDVRMHERMSFGYRLATVIRGRRVAHSAAAVDPSFWEGRLPSVKVPDHPEDVVIKYQYDRDSQLLISSSDPRHTHSADPLHPESAKPGTPSYDPANQAFIDHQRHLTLYEYGPGPRFELRRTVFPDRTRPSPFDGVGSVTNIVEVMARYDSRGRPLKRVDVRGYETFNEYYPASLAPTLRAKEGYLRRQLVPHIDWVLDNQAPNILEIQTNGVWRAFQRNLFSSGAVGDHVLISVVGVRIALYQSTDLVAILSTNAQVAISVDGVVMSPWDQTTDSVYVIKDLPVGHHKVEIRDASGVPVSIGRIRTHVSNEYGVDDLGRVLRQTDARGNVTHKSVNALGHITLVTAGPASNPSVVHYERDPAGRLVLERAEWRDETGKNRPEAAVVKRYEYDQAGLLVSQSVRAQNFDEYRISRNRYDSEDNLWENVNARGSRTYMDYDALNRQIKVIRAACSTDQSITTTTYTLSDQILSQRNPRRALHFNGYRTSAGKWQPRIDSLGRVRIQTDPMGHMTVTDYDKLDKPTVVRRFQRRADGRFEMLSRKVIDYDEHGDTIRLTEAVFSNPIVTLNPADLDRTDNEFFAANRAGNIQSATTEFYLDAGGNTVGLRSPDGGVQRSSVDAQGRVYHQVDAEGGSTFRVFDANSNIARVYIFAPARDPASRSITHNEVFLQLHEYDELNREMARIDSYGNRWEKQYDNVGSLVRTRDPLGNITRFRHNSFGEVIVRKLVLTQTGLGQAPVSAELITRFEYDANGNTTALIDPAQRRTEYKYDALDREIESWFEVSPSEHKEYRSYDPAGNLRSITNRNGLIKILQYDLLDRHIRTDIDTSSATTANALSIHSPTFLSFQYDAAGNRIQHQNEYCTVEIKRDSRGLPLLERIRIQNIANAPTQKEITRSFDLSGRREAISYPSGRELIYFFDKLGRVITIQDAVNGTGVAAYNYVGQRLSHVTYGNGLSLSLRHDGRGFVYERFVSKQDGTVLWRLQSLKDGAGHTRLENKTTRAGEMSRKLSYDSIYRLVHYDNNAVSWFEAHGAITPPKHSVEPSTTNGQALIDAHIGSLNLPLGPSVFQYDEMGNRTQTSEPNLTPISSVPNSLNQYSTVDGSAWKYDLNGNLREDEDRKFAYDYNDTLQVITQKNTNNQEVLYFRDALGRVIAEKREETTFRIYDGNMPLSEISGNSEKEFTAGHLPNVVVHAISGGNDFWMTQDGLNSVRLLTNSVGDILSMPSYRPFGESEDGELALSPFHFGFAEMWHTPGIPFYHSRRRSYRADLGRHLQRDPAGFVDNLNLYTYVRNNPISYSDPSGYVTGMHEGFTVPDPVSDVEDSLQLTLDEGLMQEMAAFFELQRMYEQSFDTSLSDAYRVELWKKSVLEPAGEAKAEMAWMMMNIIGFPLNFVPGWSGVALTAFGSSVEVAAGGSVGEAGLRLSLSFTGKWAEGVFARLAMQRMRYAADVAFESERAFLSGPPGWYAKAYATSVARTGVMLRTRAAGNAGLAEAFDWTTSKLRLRSTFDFGAAWSKNMNSGLTAMESGMKILDSSGRINKWPMRLIVTGGFVEDIAQAITPSPLWRK